MYYNVATLHYVTFFLTPTVPYNERLSILKLPSLYYRSRRGDMILVYQIFNSLIDINPSIFFAPATISTTRRHNYKIFKPHFQCLTRSNIFSNCVINDWNSLPTNIVNATSINDFKPLLDEHWQNSFIVLHLKANLGRFLDCEAI